MCPLAASTAITWLPEPSGTYTVGAATTVPVAAQTQTDIANSKAVIRTLTSYLLLRRRAPRHTEQGCPLTYQPKPSCSMMRALSDPRKAPVAHLQLAGGGTPLRHLQPGWVSAGCYIAARFPDGPLRT